KYDAVSAICWNVQDNFGDSNQEEHLETRGVIIVLPPDEAARGASFTGKADGLSPDIDVKIVSCEADLFASFIALVMKVDPEFILGYEVQKGSIGYMIERGKILNPPVDVTEAISRTPTEAADSRNTTDSYGRSHASGI